MIPLVVCVVIAAVSVANIVKSSLGPVGLDKMLVDDVGVSGSCITTQPPNTISYGYFGYYA